MRAERRRIVVALATAGGLLVLGATSAVAGPPDTDAGANAATIVAGFEDASAYPPLERLGRWDGTTYVDVAAGSVTTDQVVVVSHGWEPGCEKRYDLLQAASSTLITVWDPLSSCRSRAPDPDGWARSSRRSPGPAGRHRS